MIGSYCIRTWSSTQPSVTLSSGEAEFYGLVKAAGAGLGHQSLMRDLGLELPVCTWTDSSAALGIATRSGLGKLRHLETHTLWVQEKVRTGCIAVRKVRGDVNPADIFTKHLPSKDKIHQLTALFGCEYRSGRAECAPLLRPHSVDGREGAHPTTGDALPAFSAVEAPVHDITRLPHLHGEQEIAEYFPRIEAAPQVANTEDWQPGENVLVDFEYQAGHVDGRSGNATRVLGRREGSASATPSGGSVRCGDPKRPDAMERFGVDNPGRLSGESARGRGGRRT